MQEGEIKNDNFYRKMKKIEEAPRERSHHRCPYGRQNYISQSCDRMLLINLSRIFVIVSHIFGADLRASGVASWYNLVTVSAALDISSKTYKKMIRKQA